ncbi:MAG: cbb3-type cytochrome c oxidase N-terminal domain-containing protein [Bacteroidota bacterium]
MSRKNFKTLLTTGLALFGGGSLIAQDINGVSSSSLMLTLIFTMIALGLVIVILALTVFYLIREKAPQAETTAEAAASVEAIPLEKKTFSWKWWNKKLVAAVPVAQEASIDMGHDYDGIRELDNSLPPWWLYGFYITIGCAIVYLAYYHIGTDWSSEKEYIAEMQEAEVIKEAYLAKVAAGVNENNVVALTDAIKIAEGEQIFITYCVACHGAEGQGGIGPNMTDEYWIHGGDIKDVFKTIKYGVIDKGMTPWQEMLKPQEMQAVASFILTLQGTNPPGAKAPQGELFRPDTAGVDTTQATANISMN